MSRLSSKREHLAKALTKRWLGGDISSSDGSAPGGGGLSGGDTVRGLEGRLGGCDLGRRDSWALGVHDLGWSARRRHRRYTSAGRGFAWGGFLGGSGSPDVGRLSVVRNRGRCCDDGRLRRGTQGGRDVGAHGVRQRAGPFADRLRDRCGLTDNRLLGNRLCVDNGLCLWCRMGLERAWDQGLLGESSGRQELRGCAYGWLKGAKSWYFRHQLWASSPLHDHNHHIQCNAGKAR